jgi:mono/diheme cytochrome c family protein
MAVAMAALLAAGMAYWLMRPPPPDLERATVVYAQRCAYCHDLEGSIGVALGPRVIASFRTARRLYNYTRLAMPYDAPRTMTDADIWLTVSYMIQTTDLAPRVTAVTDANADDITLEVLDDPTVR